MAKRYRATDCWKKPFIKKLPAEYKLFWFYILDDCDHAGIWQVDIEVAQLRTGENINIMKAEELFLGKIEIFDNGEKWFIPDFIDFQYGELKSNNKVHQSIIQILKKNKLKFKGLGSPLDGAKDKEKEMDKELDMDKYITVGNEKITNIIKILEHKEASLNGRQAEHSTRNWRHVVPEWFETVLQHPFEDERHVFNTFSKYLITYGKPPTGQRNGTYVKKLKPEELNQ